MNVMDRVRAHRKRWREAEKEVRDRVARALNEADDSVDPTLPAVTSWPNVGDEFTVDLTLEDGTPVRATVRVTLHPESYVDLATKEDSE
jgi:carbon monoxide dehydrogenase subunit G